MIRTDLIKQSLAENHMTLRQLADCLEMTPRTLYSRMRKGIFRSDEMERMIRLLHLSNPCEVFFDLKDG